MPVYFLRNMTTGSIKIGWCLSQELNRRRSVLQTGNEHELLMIAAVPGDRLFEADLKARFAEYRIRGEWFRGEPELLRQLAEVITGSFVRWGSSPEDSAPKRPRKEIARLWLVERFREKREWPSDELFRLAKEHGVSRDAVFEAKLSLDVPKPRKVVRQDESTVWCWWVPDDWPYLTENTPTE